MVFSVISNATMQFLFLLTVLFTIGDLDRISSSPLPIIEVYHQATGSRAATNLLMTMLILIAFVAFFNIIASVSRLILAFSRDSGLPFSPVFAKVHVTLGVPVNALLLVASCLCILALINIGSSVAFNAFISLPALGLYISYFFPIFFLFWRRVSRKGMENIHWGPFRLGDKVGPLVNAAAMCYIVFIVIWLPFPAMLPVDRLNMNYSGPILGAVMLLGAFDWCVSGRKRFGVPAGGVQGLGGSI
jgi:amino acid transporter